MTRTGERRSKLQTVASVLMIVLMVLGTVGVIGALFGDLFKAEAAAGSYTVVLNKTIDNDIDGGYLKVTITYKTDNGTGTETSQEYSLNQNSSSDTLTIPGFPSAVSWKAKGAAWDIYKGHFTSVTINGVSAWSGTSGWDSGGGFYANEKTGSFSLSATSPAMTTITVSGAASHTIPKTGATNLTSQYSVSAAYDQYGVRWYTEPTSTFWINATQPTNSSEAAHDTATGCSISSSGLLTVRPGAQIAGTTNSTTVWVSIVNGSAWGTMAVTLNDPQYAVKFYDGNGSQFGSTQNIYYGCDASAPSGTPTKDADDTYHYTFSSWNTYTNITNDTNVNANFASVTHTYGAWSDNNDGTHSQACTVCGHTVTENITYTVAFNGNGATDGSTADQTFTYGTAQNLTANGFTREYTVSYDANGGTVTPSSNTATYTFNGWNGSQRLISDLDTEHTEDHMSGDANNVHDYKEIVWYTVEPPFAADEKYHLEFDARGNGELTNYFYGESGYLQIASGVNNAGQTFTGTDGNVKHALTNDYQHYTVTWTLSGIGDPTVQKKVLFRVFGGNSASVKNIVFWKETGEVSYTDGQSVNNLCTTSGAVYQMRAQWTPGSVTLPTPTYAGYAFAGWYTDEELTALIEGDTFTPTENTTLYAKWTKVVNDDLFILQNNRPTTLNVTGNDANGATITSVGTGTGFTVSKTADNKKVVFTPGGEMNDAVTFTYTASLNGVTGEATVTVVPATNIYYEENGFITFAPDSKWAHAGTEYTDVFQEGQRPGESGSPMGAYESTEQGTIETTFSMGEARYVTVKKGDTGATATFTFTGTGFDFYAATTNRAGLAFVDIYQYNPGHADADADGYVNIEATMVNTYFGYEFGPLYLDENDNVTLTETETPIWLTNDTGSDTFFISGTSRGTKTPFDGAVQATGWVATKSGTEDGLYQVPVISRTMNEYGTYKVVIEPRYSARQDMTGAGEYKFYVDAVRIYNPVAPANIKGEVLNAYTADKELDVTYQSVRSLLIDRQEGGEATDGVAFLDLNGAADTIDLAKYKDIGPKNEVYLMNSQAISFTMSASSTPAKLCIGLKMVRGSSGTVKINNNANPVEITGMTDIYHDITDLVEWNNNSCSILVTNTSGADIVISVTKLKWSYGAETTASANQMSFSFTPQNLVTAKAVARSLQAEQTEPETVTPDTPTTPTAPQYPQADSGRRMLTLQSLLEMIFGRFFEALRLTFIKR